ncbi:hypothetical protein JCM19239_3152 [Vibrio variabilis]|uniref:Uncharacterized protein n=1 Tax=Vibrio variabilis TaxID=990271 RepID=A0ABQ0JR86_9VIBR|nr:hypothetical protein JCM19239_3152 [Vibrio variabilis]
MAAIASSLLANLQIVHAAKYVDDKQPPDVAIFPLAYNG